MKLAFVFPNLPLIISQCAKQNDKITIPLIDNQAITIIGTPQNAKMSALIENEQGIFYIKNLASWGDNQSKIIKVSGILSIEIIETNPNEPIKTQASGKIYWIENYKIE